MPKVSKKKAGTAKDAVAKKIKEGNGVIAVDEDKVEATLEEAAGQTEINNDIEAAEGEFPDAGEAETECLAGTFQTDVENDEKQSEEDGYATEENIDDIIGECTGKGVNAIGDGNDGVDDTTKEDVPADDEDGETEYKEKPEPWYVARAKRLGDYYNW